LEERPDRSPIKVGEVYEDCDYNIVLCLKAEDGELSGISLIDGSYPHSCDEQLCSVERIPLAQVTSIRLNYGRWRPAHRRGQGKVWNAAYRDVADGRDNRLPAAA
jgi:hypothetical protein